MRISRLEDGKAGRVIVHLEDGTVFPLSKKEMKNLQMEPAMDLSEEQLEWIFEELVFVRGRNYLIHLLFSRDYTVKEVREKLLKACYPDIVIENIIAYGLEKHYLDDLRYAEDYIRYKKESKSIRQLKYQLSLKGIPSDILDMIEEKDDPDFLEEKVRRYWDKKKGTDYEKSAKTFQYFVRKGYDSSIIKGILRNISCK